MYYTEKITVIVPVYNAASYIMQCLRSIQQQTYKNLEIILIDDRSIDASGQICDEYSKNDPRFIAIHQENGGVSSARNTGLDIATGDLLGFVDPDDYIAPDFYEKLHCFLIDDNADLAVSGVQFLGETGDYCSPLFCKLMNGNTVIYESKREILNWILLGQFNVVAWDKLYKQKLWKNTRFPIGLNLGEDMAVVPGVCAGAQRVTPCT